MRDLNGRCDTFTEIPLRKLEALLPCPFCGSAAKLYDSRDFLDHHKKVVSCSNGGEFGVTDECILALPSIAAYRETKKDAMAVWNTRAPIPIQPQPIQHDIDDASCYND